MTTKLSSITYAQAAKDAIAIQDAYLLNADIARDKVAFIAQFLTKRLTPVLTAIQEHDAVCPTFDVKGKTGVTFSVGGAALPPFYSRATQREIGAEISSKYHVGE